MKRTFFFLIGVFATFCAVVGVLVPGMPTTVFLIIALWAFSKSSQRLHTWLSRLPLFKHAMKHVALYDEHKAITKKAKIVAQLCAWLSAIIICLSPAFLIIKIVVFVLALGCSIAMFRLRTVD